MFENKDEKKAKAEAVKTEAVKTEAVGSAPVALTEEQKKAKKNAASKKMIAKKKAAAATLQDLANRLGTPEDKAAAAYLMGEGRTPGVARAPAQDYIATLFKGTVGSTIGEGEVFKATKMGRLEMRALIKKEVNRGNWIAFDAEKEIYTFVAKGDKAPAGWNGPQPKAAKL